ncbi:chromatin modification-related protein EAF7-domain-containing protein, partial [Phakopsora pachyrhizi]
STDAETALFRAIIKYRPRGLNRHFSMIGICKDLERDLGNSISSDQIWSFLSSCYDLDLLNEMEPDRLDDFDYIQTIRNVTSSSAPSLDRLKYFKEFQLPIHPATPEELSFLKLVDERRLETEVESPRTDHKTSSIGQSDPYESQENLNNVSKDEIKLTFGGDDGMESDLTEPDDFEDEEEEEEEEEE